MSLFLCYVRAPFKLALLNWMPLDKYWFKKKRKKITHWVVHDGAALKKYVAISVEVVAWCAWELLECIRDIWHTHLFYGFALAVFSIFAAQITEIFFLLTLAPQQLKPQANRATTLLWNNNNNNNKNLHTVKTHK